MLSHDSIADVKQTLCHMLWWPIIFFQACSYPEDVGFGGTGAQACIQDHK